MKIFLFISLFLGSMTIDEVYNKILTDKFFKGIVADNLIENNKHIDVVKGNFYTYSQLRYAVMIWIEENPKEAAKRFSEIVSLKGEYNVKFKLYEYKINPKFKKLIDLLNDSAKKDDMSIEERRFFSSLIFEDRSETSNYSLNIQDRVDYDVSQENRISYNYVNINEKLLAEVIKEINDIYNYLRSFKVVDISDIIDRADEKYVEFQKLIASIGGSLRISPSQAKYLKEIFSELKKLFILRFFVVKYRNIELKIKSINKSYEYYDKILKDIEINIKELYQKNINFDDFEKLYIILNEVSRELDFLIKANNIYFELENESYSCLFDFIARKIYPTQKYKMILNKKKELLNYFSSLFEENKLNSVNLDINEFVSKLKEVEEIISIERTAMYRHRKIQFIFFDSIFLFDLSYDKNRKLKFNVKNDLIDLKK